MLEADLLKLICCPETRQPLAPADAATLARLNQKILAGGVLNRAGSLVKESCEAGFVRQDGQVLYPVRQGIPILLVAEGIPLNPPAR